jgi:lysophospholipase L1-like esterase
LNVTSSISDRGCRLGVLAFGDSITNGGGELQWGVALQSWALCVARATGLPFTTYAVDGARVADVLHQQIPAFERDDRGRSARYDVGCLYVGVNDVRAVDWSATAFERDFAAALGSLARRCDRTIALTAPRDLGRPPAGPKVAELDAAIEHIAAMAGVLRVDLADFGARNHVMVDHVHPTAFGQIAIAERALAVLNADGLSTNVAPSSLIRYDPSRWQRLRGDATYVYRHAKVSARAGAIRLRAARLARSRRAGDGRASS